MSLRASLSFFTRLPVGSHTSTASLAGLTAYLPAVGLIVGLCVGLSLCFFASFFPPTLAGILGACTWVVITGGLHLDGLADCADGLVVEAPKEKRLAIMKDPTVGTFASIALFFILALKVATLTHLVQTLFSRNSLSISIVGILTLCFVASLARTMVFLAHSAPNAREHEKIQNLGKALTQGLTRTTKRKNALLMALVASITWLAVLFFPVQSLFAYSVPLACISVLIVTYTLINKAKKCIGGVTGDVYGCLIELCECAALLSFCLI